MKWKRTPKSFVENPRKISKNPEKCGYKLIDLLFHMNQLINRNGTESHRAILRNLCSICVTNETD